MPAEDPRFTEGMAALERVLGAEYAARARRSAADPFVAPFTELATAFVWGGPWCRAGLDPRTRSLLTLAMLIALGHPEEVRLHVGGALANGATRDELREVVIHALPYCGAPAALAGLKAVVAALREAEGAGAG